MDAPAHTLIVSVNWMGDVIMAMPAIQRYRAIHPDTRLTVLTKPAVRALWELHDAPDSVITIATGAAGIWQTTKQLRAAGPFDIAYVLPHSFRSALLPWLSRVPRRVGLPGHVRDCMLTEIIRPNLSETRCHQVYEYLDLLGLDDDRPPPALTVPDDLREQMQERVVSLQRPLVVLVPGAARGPAKQWPSDRFVAVGRRLAAETGAGVIVSGTAAERTLCASVAAGIGERARNWAGRTGVKEWVGLLAESDVVIANDSGAMHVAAALDTPVVAIFGCTDPATTGPLGSRATVLQDHPQRSRDVPRDSAEARSALAAISVDAVFDAACRWLQKQESVS